MGIIIRNMNATTGLTHVRMGKGSSNIIDKTFFTKDSQFTLNEEGTIATTTGSTYKLIRTNIDINAIRTNTLFEFQYSGTSLADPLFGILDGLGELTSGINLGSSYTTNSVTTGLINAGIETFQVFTGGTSKYKYTYMSTISNQSLSRNIPSINKLGLLINTDTKKIDIYANDIYITSSVIDYTTFIDDSMSVNNSSMYIAVGGYANTTVEIL